MQNTFILIKEFLFYGIKIDFIFKSRREFQKKIIFYYFLITNLQEWFGVNFNEY